MLVSATVLFGEPAELLWSKECGWWWTWRVFSAINSKIVYTTIDMIAVRGQSENPCWTFAPEDIISNSVGISESCSCLCRMGHMESVRGEIDKCIWLEALNCYIRCKVGDCKRQQTAFGVSDNISLHWYVIVGRVKRVGIYIYHLICPSEALHYAHAVHFAHSPLAVLNTFLLSCINFFVVIWEIVCSPWGKNWISACSVLSRRGAAFCSKYLYGIFPSK